MPPSTTPTQPRRRLVPDASDSIQVGGERLVRAVRVAVETPEQDAASPKSIDEVAEKHLSRDIEQVAGEYPEFMEALSSADTDRPSPAIDIASRIELFTDGAEAIPNPEADATRRVGMTMSPVIGTDDAPDFLSSASAPETLFDLFSLFPALDGLNQFIYVERKDPKLFGGRKVAGIMRPIGSPLTLAEWQQIYGGGTYKLIVYGPPKRGGVMNADGRVQPKALTEAITVTFPGVPSSEGEVYDDDEEADMTQQTPHGFPRRGPASIADANVVKAQLDADLTREDRQDKKEREARERDEQRQKDREREQGGIAKQVTDLAKQLADQQAEFRREAIDLQRQHQEEMRQQQKEFEEKLNAKKPERDPLETALMLSKNLHGDSQGSSAALESLRAEHARELDRLTRQSQDEHTRAERRVAEERERCDRLIEDEKRRSQERVSEVERRAREFETDIRGRADKELQQMKEEVERRVNELHRQSETRLSDLDRNHQRDLAAQTAQHALAMETVKSTLEMRLDTTKAEVKRASAEADRYKKDAEDNKDFVGKFTKFKEEAASLGMIDASEAAGAAEPETVPQMLLKAASGVIQNAPAILDNVATLFRQRGQHDLQAARQQGRSEMIEQASRGFAPAPLAPSHRPPALGGFVPRHMSEMGPAPLRPGTDPFVVPPPVQFVPEPIAAPEPVAVVAHYPGHTGMPPEPQMQPYPSASPQLQPIGQVGAAVSHPAPSVPPSAPARAIPPPASSLPPSTAQDLNEDREILQAESILLPQYTANVTPSVVADGMLEHFGVTGVTNLISSIDAERVILAIQRSGDPASPLLRRDGRKYIRAIFEELKKRLPRSP